MIFARMHKENGTENEEGVCDNYNASEKQWLHGGENLRHQDAIWLDSSH